MAAMQDLCPVIVFAKAPVPGFAKTRLIPALGAQGAARLAERLLEETLRQALASAIGPVLLCCTPDASHAAFKRMAQRFAVTLSVQGEGDLGQRMCRALEAALEGHSRVVLIGTDAPGLDAAVLRLAADALLEHEAVFGPATDGGYTLVGLSRPAPGLFEGIAWSTPQVMLQTRERIVQQRLRHAELPELHDIDEPADLVHLPHHWLTGLKE